MGNAVATAAAVFAPSLRLVSVAGKAALGTTLVLTVAAHAVRFPAALSTNLIWVGAMVLAIGLAVLWLSRYPGPPAHARPGR